MPHPPGPGRPIDTLPRDDFEQAAREAAHEIAGPLAAIAAAVDLLDTVPDDDPADTGEVLALIRRQLELARLRVARLSHLQSGPANVCPVPTNLTVLADTLVADLRPSVLADHPTQVQGPEPLTANVDADQIRQVLFNLLTNAARYSPAGREIVVSLAVIEQAVQVRVRDQGHGVAPDDAKRIFARYERGASEGRGMGLGLTLSRDIARAHGGELSLEQAKEDSGSTFLLELPYDADGGSSSATASTTASGTTSGP